MQEKLETQVCLDGNAMWREEGEGGKEGTIAEGNPAVRERLCVGSIITLHCVT